MNRYKRYSILIIFAIIFYFPIALFIDHVYENSLSEYIKHEKTSKQNVYDVLNINNYEDLRATECLKAEMQHVLKDKYILLEFPPNTINIFDSNLLSAFSNEVDKKLQLEISKTILNEEIYTKLVRLENLWYFLTFIKVSDSDKYIFSLTVSDETLELEEDKKTAYNMLILVMFLIVVLLNMTIKYMKNIKDEKQELSIGLGIAKQYFENASIGFLVVDKNRNILNINSVFCEMFGYKKSELLGKNAEVLHISKESSDEWAESIIHKDEELINISYKVRKKDGTHFWIEVSGRQSDKNKELFNGGIVWSARDITSRIEYNNTIKDLNKTLSNNLEHLKVVLDAIPLPIFVKDKDNIYIECNNACLDITNVKKDEIINHKTEDILPEYLARVHAKKDLELLSNDNIHYKEIYDSRYNKTLIYEFFKTALKKDGKYDGYICAMVNVTKHEEQEAYLERRVDELVPLLNNEVMKNMNLSKEHEKARLRDVKFSVIGQLSAGITHEINTPLTYVKGNIEMMKMDLEDLEDSKIKKNLLEDFSHVDSGITKIATIVESMREMSQHTKETTEVVNIFNTIAVSLVMAYNRSKYVSIIYLNGKEFNFNFDKKEFVFLSKVQEQRIEQVWVVIVNNALDELQKKGSFDDRELVIECKEEDEKIVVTFRDNAGGIDLSILDNLFEPFVSNKPQGGMGVGLSIAKKIVEDQEGNIHAYNDEYGAIFKITLPKA